MNSFQIIMPNGETVTVTGEYIRPSRGMRDSLGGRPGAGPALEPDEPGDFEIEAILNHDERDITADVTDDDLEYIVNEIVRTVEEDQEPDEPDYDYTEPDYDNYPDYYHPTY